MDSFLIPKKAKVRVLYPPWFGFLTIPGYSSYYSLSLLYAQKKNPKEVELTREIHLKEKERVYLILKGCYQSH